MQVPSSDEMLVDSCFHYRKQSPCDVCGASARTAATPIAGGPRGSPYTIAIDCERALNGSLPEHLTEVLHVVRADKLGEEVVSFPLMQSASTKTFNYNAGL